ncbi:hypothetical protein LZ30DRAFT_723848 [Colletotrichum cereale]|nr:hypothetical protein LZ30DRAFT_723848 [Colletotrichum cereale]
MTSQFGWVFQRRWFGALFGGFLVLVSGVPSALFGTQCRLIGRAQRMKRKWGSRRTGRDGRYVLEGGAAAVSGRGCVRR